MSNQLLTPAELDLFLQSFLSRLMDNEDSYYIFCFILYVYGFRYNEVKNCNNWQVLNENEISVPLSKGQGSRIINLYLSDYGPLNQILAYYKYFYYVNPQTFQNIWKKNANGFLFLNSGKSLLFHAFRHSYIKKLFAQGMTAQQISNLIGEVNVNNVSGYINSHIELFTN